MINLQLYHSGYRLLLKKSVFLSLLLLYVAFTQAQLTVHFNYCSSTLSPAEKNKIRNFISCSSPQEVSIAGHTGNTKGREAANQLLSEKRAAAVADFVHTLPCTISIDSVIGYGGTRPAMVAVKSNAANRRAEITFLHIEPIAIKEPYDANAAMGKEQFAALYQQLATPPQSFCVSPQQDTMLVGEKGTIIQIKKGDLAISECSCVTILLNEYFDKSEMILNNMTTSSDGKQLESDGMIRIEALCNGKEVPLSAGRSISILIPTDTILPGMKLFTAQRDSASQILNWSGKMAGWPQSRNLDTLNYGRIWNWCGFGGGGTKTAKCPFFFCGLLYFIKHPFGPKRFSLADMGDMATLPEERAAAKKYGFKPAAMKRALEKSKEKDPKLLQYYVFQNTGWGYRNCDRYPPETITNSLYVNETPKDNINTKYVEKYTKSIIAGYPRIQDYSVDQIAVNKFGWAIAIKLTESKIFLSLKSCNSSDKATTPEYREVTLAELRQNIRSLDAN